MATIETLHKTIIIDIYVRINCFTFAADGFNQLIKCFLIDNINTTE